MVNILYIIQCSFEKNCAALCISRCHRVISTDGAVQSDGKNKSTRKHNFYVLGLRFYLSQRELNNEELGIMQGDSNIC